MRQSVMLKVLGPLCLQLSPTTVWTACLVPPPQEILLPHADLCVTEGTLDDVRDLRMLVNVPKMRAYVNRQTTDTVELRFTFLGPTATQLPLASGASRQQLGLKLRAADACNLVYVMWRLEPSSQLVVSVKSNAGQHSSSECGNHGYRDVHPRSSDAVPRLKPGDTHRLRAGIAADELRVFIDDRLVWLGTLPPDGAGMKGPVGVRTDNVRLNFQLGMENTPVSAESRAGNSKSRASCEAADNL
jgi:hypothetical protein